jgi:hypothetical protein
MMAGLQNFTFTPESPSDTWIITHNFGRLVNVDTRLELDGVVFKVLPLKVVADPGLNEITITWSSPQTGSALVT